MSLRALSCVEEAFTEKDMLIASTSEENLPARANTHDTRRPVSGSIFGQIKTIEEQVAEAKAKKLAKKKLIDKIEAAKKRM